MAKITISYRYTLQTHFIRYTLSIFLVKIIAKRKDGEIIKQGWLYKQSSSSVVGGGLKTWRKRWFLLSDLCLFYYKGNNSLLTTSYFWLRFVMD